MIESNLARRHLNDFQKCEMGIELQKINEEIAKQKEHSRKTGLSPFGETPFHSNKETAKQIGVSERTFERGKYIIENASEKIKNTN